MPTAGRYATAYSDRELLIAAAVVAVHAVQSDSDRVTHARFDAARQPAGHPDLPSADRIVRRLGVPLTEILARAADGRDPTQWLTRRHAPTQHTPDAEEAAHSLRVAAAFLHARTLTPGAYRRAREALLAADRVRHHRGWLVLLTDSQIRAAYHDDWPAALTAAGLTVETATDGRTPTRGGQRRGVPVAEAIDRCVDYHGALPTTPDLDRFAAAHGFALSRRDAPWAELVQRMRDARSVRGQWTPPRSLKHSQAPDFAAIIPESDPLAAWKGSGEERRANRFWTREECVAAVARFLAEQPGRKLTQRAYADWVAGQPDPLPQVSSLQQHGAFSAIVAEAHRRRAAG